MNKEPMDYLENVIFLGVLNDFMTNGNAPKIIRFMAFPIQMAYFLFIGMWLFIILALPLMVWQTWTEL